MIKYIIIILIILIFLYVLITYNKLIKLKNKVIEAFSLMDVYLKKRYDLVPNMVSIVKNYSKYENDTLVNIINSRNNYDNISRKEKINTNEIITNDLNKLTLLVEDYPDLHANETYKNLYNELISIEKDIMNSRKYYNGCVRLYNNLLEMFPSNIVSKILRLKKENLYLAKIDERENINVEF